ncbi:MAG: hypothetical protein R3B99_07645 [Polyangiales bacterium]
MLRLVFPDADVAVAGISKDAPSAPITPTACGLRGSPRDGITCVVCIATRA